MLNGKIKTAIATLTLGLALLLTSMPVQAAGLLSIAVSKTSMNIGDTVVVTVYANDENGQGQNADMTITYDSSLLEYVGSSAHSASGGGGKVTAVGSEIEYTFKAIGSGNASVVAESTVMTSSGVKIPISGGTATTTEEPAKQETKQEEKTDVELPAETADDESSESADGDTSEDASSDVKTEGNSTLRSETEEEIEEVALKEGLVLADDINAHVTQTTGAKVTVNNVIYEISCSLSPDDIPPGYEIVDIEYEGKEYAGLKSKNGYIYMLYLVNTEDNNDQGFYVYEPDSQFFYPFIRIFAGKKRIQIMNPVDIVVVPDGFTKVMVTYNNKKFTAYRCDTDPDFLAFYGANVKGQTAWYQFDNKQLTLQRLNIITVYPETNEEDEAAYNKLNDAYEELSDKYVNEKNSYITTVAVLIFAIAFLLVVIINLILRCREIRHMYEYEEFEEYDESEEENNSGSSFVEEQYSRLRKTEENPRAEVIHKTEKAKDDFDINDIKIAEIDPFELEEKPKTEIKAEPEKPQAEEPKKRKFLGKFAKSMEEDDEDDFYDDFDDEDEEIVVPAKKERKMPSQDNSIAVRESVMRNSGESLIGRKEKTPEFKSSDDDDDLEFLDI